MDIAKGALEIHARESHDAPIMLGNPLQPQKRGRFRRQGRDVMRAQLKGIGNRLARHGYLLFCFGRVHQLRGIELYSARLKAGRNEEII